MLAFALSTRGARGLGASTGTLLRITNARVGRAAGNRSLGTPKARPYHDVLMADTDHYLIEVQSRQPERSRLFD